MLEMNLGKYDGKQVINRDAILATQQPLMISSQPREPFGRAGFYGLGIGVGYDEAGRLRLSHSGAFSMGAATSYDLLPSEHLGIVILTNGEPSGVPESIAKMFYDKVEFGKVTRDWYAAFSGVFAQILRDSGELIGKQRPTHPTASAPLPQLAGSYANAYYGPATVAVRREALTLTLGPKHTTYTLGHWNGNVFSFTPSGESGTGLNAVTFTPASTGHPASVVIEYLNESGLGTFTKL